MKTFRDAHLKYHAELIGEFDIDEFKESFVSKEAKVSQHLDNITAWINTKKKIFKLLPISCRTSWFHLRTLSATSSSLFTIFSELLGVRASVFYFCKIINHTNG